MRLDSLALLVSLGATPPSAPTPVAPLVVSPPSQSATADADVTMAGDQDDDEVQTLSIWPGSAYFARLDGHVRLRCDVDVHGLAERCDVIAENPAGKGFGRAALALRATFRFAPAWGTDGPVPSRKTIAITFDAPRSRVDTGDQVTGGNIHNLATTRYAKIQLQVDKVTLLTYPVWAAAPDFNDVARVYPEKADGAEGYVVTHCQVMHSGALRNCVVIKETPKLRGFAKAALTLTEKFAVTPALAVAMTLTA